MDDNTPQPQRALLTEKLADSLTAPFPAATPRRVHGTVRFPGKATAVIGMRRAGKTTFLHQLRPEQYERGIDRVRLPYINFEDERLVDLQVQDLHLLIEEYYRRFPVLRGQEVVTWCFDELQVVAGWERFIRRLLDTEKVEVCLSGSSAALLSREIATAMRGRAWEVVIHPFSFEEALRHQGHPIPQSPDFLPAPERSALERAFLDYLSLVDFRKHRGSTPQPACNCYETQ
jgi:predicted AAA+ superfamily ATPase